MSTADYFERRWTRDFDGDELSAARAAIEAMQERGAVHLRMCMRGTAIPGGTDFRVVIVEGWRTQPEDEGDLPI